MIYKLILPIKISFMINDSEMRIQDIDDLIYLQEKYNVDLQQIIDEYEYKLETEDKFLVEDEDFFCLNRIDILQSTINDNLPIITEKFNREVKLSSLEINDVNKLFTFVKEEFNKTSLLSGYNNEYIINSIRIETYDLLRSSLIINVDVDRELKESELKELKNLIDHKCVDEWGSEFEENDISDIIDVESMYVCVKFWDKDNQIDFI
jgi:hypothetical protein